jgi:kumamolisin
MKRSVLLAGMILLVVVLFTPFVSGQEIRNVGPTGYVFVPASSIQHPEDVGVRAHTNTQLFISNLQYDSSQPPPNAETPASLGCVYQLTSQVSGCPIHGTTQNPSGGWGAVAIVDAFDNPNAEEDLTAYSTQFGLPACTKANGCFSQVYARGSQPQNNPGGWSLEIALDIEMAHAFAPNAKIILVEAQDNSFTELYFAEDLAAQLVQQAGGGSVTNSWSGGEYPSETADDSHFKANGVVYFASTGDNAAPVGFPAASPFVVAAGGTTVSRSGGNFTGESGWNDSGGGPSSYEPRPTYQSLIQSIVGSKRGTPDFSADANPATGVAMYDKDGNLLWLQIGGTSVSSPMLAAIVNADGYKAKSTAQELGGVYPYAKSHYAKRWRDEITGFNGYSCTKGWDFVTGIGSPLTAIGK